MKKLLLLLCIIVSLKTLLAGGGHSTLKNETHHTTNLFWQLKNEIEYNGIDSIERLITNKNTANFFPEGESTLLQLAVFYKRPEIIAILLKKGADINAKNSSGNTALHTAIELAAIGRRMSCDESKLSPLNKSILRRQTKNLYAIILQLLNEGACLNIKNNMGKAPFDLAGTTPLDIPYEENLIPESSNHDESKNPNEQPN